MRWVLGLVGTGIDGPSISVNIMEFDRPDCLEDITNLGLTLAERKQLVALAQEEIVAAQVGNHAVLRPACRTPQREMPCERLAAAPHRHTVRRGEGAPSPVRVCGLRTYRDRRQLAIALPINPCARRIVSAAIGTNDLSGCG